MMLRGRKAGIYLHGTSLVLLTCSGPGACVQDDWECPVFRGDLSTIADSALGIAVRAAWARCREIPLVDYKSCVSAHMKLLGVKTQKALYANTKTVHPSLHDGMISIRPTYQYSVGAFKGLEPEIRLLEAASDEALGQGVREALAQSKATRI